MTLSRLAQILSFLLLTTVIYSLCFAAPLFTEREDVKSFINEMVSKHGFEKSELIKVFDQVVIKESSIESTSSPAEAKPWHAYRPILVGEKRINDGAKFWKKHKKELERAQNEYGVPAEVIVAIIGVESDYGKRQGEHRVVDALSTLAFNYKPRASFFRSELEQLLLLAREEKIDINSILGSYAGAFGIPQFMPSSFRHYAIDFTNDGHRDITNNPVDAIGTVANYFKKNGWRQGEEVVVAAKPETKNFSLPDQNDKKYGIKYGIKPSHTTKEFAKIGIKPIKKLPDTELVSLMEFENKDAKEYWFGLNNFYVITRYNKSQLFAMAVHQLSQEIHTLYHENA